MGTRSLTVFKDNGEEICVMYRQFDGYVEGGLGDELVEFLKGKEIVNGYGSQEDTEKPNFNGMGCLAAQVIANLKNGIGNIYLHPAGTRDCGEEYIYTIEDVGGFPKLTVFEVYEKREQVLLEGNTDSLFNGMSYSMEELREYVGNKSFQVTFRKVNGGEIRVMKATRGEDFILNLSGGRMKFNTDEKRLLPVWDLENEAFRMVNVDTITKLRFIE